MADCTVVVTPWFSSCGTLTTRCPPSVYAQAWGTPWETCHANSAASCWAPTFWYATNSLLAGELWHKKRINQRPICERRTAKGEYALRIHQGASYQWKWAESRCLLSVAGVVGALRSERHGFAPLWRICGIFWSGTRIWKRELVPRATHTLNLDKYSRQDTIVPVGPTESVFFWLHNLLPNAKHLRADLVPGERPKFWQSRMSLAISTRMSHIWYHTDGHEQRKRVA